MEKLFSFSIESMAAKVNRHMVVTELIVNTVCVIENPGYWVNKLCLTSKHDKETD